VIVPPAGSCGVAKDRMAGEQDGVPCVDWLFCTKQISEQLISEALGPA
jgi:peroxiredoxin (alkyl hydroperoxide reductase subunit C)